MPSPQLQSELIQLKALIAQADALASAARSQAGLPVPPNGPVIGLPVLVQAMEAQQEVLKKVLKLLEKMAE